MSTALLKRWYWMMRGYRICAGVATPSTSWRLWRAYMNADATDDQRLIDVRIKQIGNRTLRLRKHGDAHSVVNSFGQAWHVMPPEIVPRSAAIILDLGANIGCTMAHFAWLYPDARILGVELDRNNAELCQQNVEHWSERCQVISAAVWERDGSVAYDSAGNYSAFAISESASQSAPAYSINTIIDKHFPSGMVDYVKMDIEGAESAVLSRNTDWASKVKAISIEVHKPYTLAQCRQDLTAIGFQSTIWNEWMVIGTRPQNSDAPAHNAS